MYKRQYQYCLGGFICAGAIFCIVAIIIKFAGVNWIDAVLPPAAMGPIVALIGLELAGSAASTGGIISSEGSSIDPKFVFVFIFTLALAIVGQVVFRGFAAAIAILIAIVSGYVLAMIMGLVDFSAVTEASVFALPAFMAPKFNLGACLLYTSRCV